MEKTRRILPLVVQEPQTPREKEPPRSCGDCRLCCKTLAVQSINKPRGEWCQHACATGCKVYETRPTQCKEFECLWLAASHEEAPTWFRDLFTLEERPDVVRAVFTPYTGGVKDPRNKVMRRAMALHVGDQGVSRVHRTVTKIVMQGFAVLHNTASRCVGVWFPPAAGTPEGPGLPPGPDLPMAYYAIPDGHPDSRLYDSFTATEEQKAENEKKESEARAEIQRRERAL